MITLRLSAFKLKVRVPWIQLLRFATLVLFGDQEEANEYWDVEKASKMLEQAVHSLSRARELGTDVCVLDMPLKGTFTWSYPDLWRLFVAAFTGRANDPAMAKAGRDIQFAQVVPAPSPLPLFFFDVVAFDSWLWRLNFY